MEDVERALEMEKFELCDTREVHIPLHENVHGVNVFTVPELKGRRRMITEPLLNGVIKKESLPKIEHPDRLARRQMLRYSKYMFQIDFEAYYDAIPLPNELRNLFVFQGKDKRMYRLKTLPTGARWSVCLAQAITWTIVDIDTPVTITTMLDNIMIAAHEGQEHEFVSAVRRVIKRIGAANLLTSPNRNDVINMSDNELLTEALKNNTFLGEEYMWNGHERLVRNSVKTVAKLELANEAKFFTNRSFVSTIALIMYAMHTTSYNIAKTFKLMRAYRAICRKVSLGQEWDAPLEYLEPTVEEAMRVTASMLIMNKWHRIADVRKPTYNDNDYHVIAYTDASVAGWGAVVQNNLNNTTTAYQQRWVNQLSVVKTKLKERYLLNKPSTLDNNLGYDENFAKFNAKFSAHAEPRAIKKLLEQLMLAGLPDNCKIAIVTDHQAIEVAQRKLNGFGGIGRGYTLNRLFEYVNDL